MHTGEHDVGTQAGTGDEGSQRTDEHGRSGIQHTGKASNIVCNQAHHAGGLRLHDIGQHQQTAHGDENGDLVAGGHAEDVKQLGALHAQGLGTQQAADEDDNVHPDDVAEGAHNRKAVFHNSREAITDDRQQDQHINVGRHGAESAVLLLGTLVGHIFELVGSLDGDQLDIQHAQQDGNETGAHGGDLGAHKIAQQEHDHTGSNAGIAQIRDDTLVALAAKGHTDHDEGDDEHAEHMDAAHHGGVQSVGGDTGFHQSGAAVDGGQTRAAPGAGSGVAQQSNGNGGDGIKAQSHQEGGGDGSGSAGTGGAFQEDGDHHADDDQLDTAILTADAGHGVLHVLDSAGLLQGVQDDEGAKDHGNDLQTFLDALPQQGVHDHHVLLKGKTVDVKIGECQQHGPNQGHGRDLHGRLLQSQDADQYDDDRADRHDKVDKFHSASSLFSAFLYKKNGTRLKAGPAASYTMNRYAKMDTAAFRQQALRKSSSRIKLRSRRPKMPRMAKRMDATNMASTVTTAA